MECEGSGLKYGEGERVSEAKHKYFSFYCRITYNAHDPHSMLWYNRSMASPKSSIALASLSRLPLPTQVKYSESSPTSLHLLNVSYNHPFPPYPTNSSIASSSSSVRSKMVASLSTRNIAC